MSDSIPTEQPYLHRTLNVGQWRDGVKKFRETRQDVTVWEDSEYLFQVVSKDEKPYCRCFWKLRSQELYCNPASYETFESEPVFTQT